MRHLFRISLSNSGARIWSMGLASYEENPSRHRFFCAPNIKHCRPKTGRGTIRLRSIDTELSRENANGIRTKDTSRKWMMPVNPDRQD